MNRRRPSTATVIALVALFVALGGTSIAASRYVITSTSQIKPSVRKALRGPTPASPSLTYLSTVNSPAVPVAAGTVGSATATCPAGTRAVSGGGTGSVADIAASVMVEHNSWLLIVVNTTPITVEIRAQVQCAGASTAIAAGVRKPPASVAREIAAAVAKVKADKAAASK